MGIFFREQKKYDDSLPEDTVLAFKASDGDESAFEVLVALETRSPSELSSSAARL